MNQKKKSIKSYGLIVYAINGKEIRYLLFQRRDTYEYMDFIRGMWSTNADLFNLFSGMSIPERCRLRDYTFSEIWNDLWINKFSRLCKCSTHQKIKFNTVKSSIPFILESTNSFIKEAPWGFPKGRKDAKEKAKDCALREFREETKIFESIEIKEIIPIFESYLGSDNKIYETNYFVGELKNVMYPCLTPSCKSIRKTTISEESNDVKWCTLHEASFFLNKRLFDILKKVDGMLGNG